MNEKQEKGLKVFSEIMGEERARQLADHATSGGFGADIGKRALEYAFADTWGRPGLERKQRSFITLGMLLALRQTLEFKNHVRIALKNGCTAKEIEELLIQGIPYVGFPAVASAQSVAVEVLREEGVLNSETKTSEERGLL